MPLKETSTALKELLAELSCDLEKSGLGNRSASQRVRTNTIKFAKIAKLFRKESLDFEKGGKKSRKKVALKRKKK